MTQLEYIWDTFENDFHAMADKLTYRSPYLDHDDLVSEAMLRITKSIHAFDPKVGNLENYVRVTAKGAMDEYAREKAKWHGRLREVGLSPVVTDDDGIQIAGTEPAIRPCEMTRILQDLGAGGRDLIKLIMGEASSIFEKLRGMRNPENMVEMVKDHAMENGWSPEELQVASREVAEVL